MRLSEVSIRADNEVEARRQATFKLDTTPDNVQVTPVGDGLWQAELIQADADVELDVAVGEMEVTVATYSPPIGDGATLTTELLAERLEQAGVTIKPVPALLEKVIKQARAGREVEGMVVAKGTPPDPGAEGFLKPRGNLDAPVVPGEIFLEIVPPRPAKSGLSVTGKEVPPADAARAVAANPVLKHGCSLTTDAKGVRADVYGLPGVLGNRVSVEPLIEVSADKMAVYGTLYPYGMDGSEFDVERLAQALKDMGIQAPLDAEGVAAGFEVVRETGVPQEQAKLCEGVAPRHGEDGRLELLVETQQAVGTMHDDGHIDFRERGTVHNVVADTLLARITPPTAGTPGVDVYGDEVPAKPGEEVAISAGENVVVSSDGCYFRSAIDGMVLFSRGVLAITDVFEIPGDVDLSTGNIRTDKGSVEIHGSVRSGFAVSCTGNIVVHETIEDAVIEAEGDVEVQRGVVMQENGRLQARGHVFAHFAQNARIVAGADVIIDNDLTNCDVVARGKVVATQGKGRIQGGTVRCGHGVEANEIGSDFGVETVIQVGLKSKVHETLNAERQTLEACVQKIDRVLGTGDTRSILVRTPKAKRPAVAKLLKARIAARVRLQESEEELGNERQEAKRQIQSRVKVHRALYPGVTVVIAGCHLMVKEALSACQLYYDPARDQVQMAPLG